MILYDRVFVVHKFPRVSVRVTRVCFFSFRKTKATKQRPMMTMT